MCLRYVYIFVGFYPLRSFWPKAYMFFFFVVWRDPSPKPIPKLSEVVVRLGLQLPVQLSEAKTWNDSGRGWGGMGGIGRVDGSW